MSTFRFLVTLVALIAFQLDAVAQSDNIVRSEFQRAYRSATTTSAANDSSALRSYLLYPYLRLARLKSALGTASPDYIAIDKEAESLIASYDQDVIGSEVRRAWYPSLAKRQEWTRLLASYRDIGDATLQCQALNGRLALQKLDGLQQAALNVWYGSPDSRPACETIFTWLRTENALTANHIEARARLALGAGNLGFARQMIAQLPADLAAPLNSWAELIDNPRKAIESAIASPQKSIEPNALFDGWTKFARRNPNGAMQLYKPLVRARAFSPELASRYAQELALSLSWNRRSEALDYFSQVRATELDDRGAEWFARSALWASKWATASKVIEGMSPLLKQQTKWKYWAARTLELQNKKDAARKRYGEIVADDNYYSALAAARLHVLHTPSPKPFAKDEATIAALAPQPAFARAHELTAMDTADLRAYAYDEWRKGLAALDNGQRAQAIIVAARWQWFDQAILTGAQLSMFSDYELLYPRPFDTYIQAAAKRTNISSALLYALLRQESLFRTDAQSTAGAQGLMQMLPGTAKLLVRRSAELRSLVKDPLDLTDANSNIQIGASYFRNLIERYDGIPAVALAAYNAGPANAERWTPEHSIDLDVWIENIPFNETRTYVQRVLWHSVVFGWLATKQGQDTSAWLHQLKP